MKILLGIPAYNLQVHSGVLKSCYKLVTQTRHEIKFMSNSVPCIPQARNEIVNAAFEINADYILFWDADIEVLSNNFLDRMVELSRKNKEAIICAPYLIKTPERRFNLIKNLDSFGKFEYITDIPNKEPFEVDAGGTGLMLIPTSIFKTLEPPYFRMIIREKDFWPEDWYFCIRAKEKGFKTIVDPSIETNHWGIRPWTYILE